MNTISNFFVGMKKDCSLLMENKDVNIKVQELRCYSLGLRTIGLVAVAFATVLVMGAVAALPSSILLSVIALVTAVAVGVFAHDCIVVGNKYHQIVALFNPVLEKGVLNTIKNVGKKISNAVNVIPTGFQAVDQQASYFLTDTWVLKHLFSCFESGEAKSKTS